MTDINKYCRGIRIAMLAAAILIFAHCSLTTAAEAIVLGDERTDEYLPLLDGKRIALFANHSAMVRGEHLLMWRRDVESFIEKSKPYLLYERKER